MGSGMYSALSGNLAKMQALDAYTNNMTNATTYGYKKDRVIFQSFLDDESQNERNKGINFVRPPQQFVDFEAGAHQPTGGAFDFAIEGEGFFKVEGEDGIYFTRLGQFRRGEDGTLMFAGRYKLLGAEGRPLVVPSGELEIDSEGRITNEGGQIGTLALFAIENTWLLEKRGGGMFRLPPDQKTSPVEEPKLIRGNLEGSNVNLMQEMALMMNSLRSFEAYQKILKTYKEIGSKANEIGSL